VQKVPEEENEQAPAPKEGHAVLLHMSLPMYGVHFHTCGSCHTCSMLRWFSLTGSHAGPHTSVARCFSAGGSDDFFRNGMMRSGSGSGAAIMLRQTRFETVSYTQSVLF